MISINYVIRSTSVISYLTKIFPCFNQNIIILLPLIALILAYKSHKAYAPYIDIFNLCIYREFFHFNCLHYISFEEPPTMPYNAYLSPFLAQILSLNIIHTPDRQRRPKTDKDRHKINSHLNDFLFFASAKHYITINIE